jgi:hypothetical protein
MARRQRVASKAGSARKPRARRSGRAPAGQRRQVAQLPAREHTGQPQKGTPPAMPGVGLTARALTAGGATSLLLEVVGEGQLGAAEIGHLLAVWQREQDRLTNRAWRRPGGLARMGGM